MHFSLGKLPNLTPGFDNRLVDASEFEHLQSSFHCTPILRKPDFIFFLCLAFPSVVEMEVRGIWRPTKENAGAMAHCLLCMLLTQVDPYGIIWSPQIH